MALHDDVTAPPKVLFVITGLGTGGAETMLLKLMERSMALRAGRVVALGGEGEIAVRLRALGVQVDTLGMSRALPNPFILHRLLRIVRDERPDVISTWLYHADLLGGIAGWIAGVPVVWGVRSTYLALGSTRWTTRAVVRACALLSRRLPVAIISCSSKAVEVHTAMGYPRERFTVVPNGFDLDLFRPDAAARAWLRAELGLAETVQLVGMVARFDPLKNHRGLVDAAREVIATRPATRFVLVGKDADPDNHEVRGWIRDAGLDRSFHLLGARSDVPRITAALDAAVLTSWAEGFPNALGEAMACGVPSVATNVGDAALILGELGPTVPAGDMAAVAHALLAALELDPAQRDARGAALRRRVQERFALDAVVGRFEEVFAQAASQTRPRSTKSGQLAS